MHVAVLGAGVVGLTAAIELQKEFRNAQVTVIAEKFGQDTTSNGAAGLFRPGTSFCGPTEQITRKWISDAYSYWENIWLSEHGPNAGVTQLSGYIFSATNESLVRNHLIEKLVPLYRTATEDELQLCPGNWKYGSFFTTMLTECSLYLPWAMDQLRAMGGQLRVMRRKINSFSELCADNYDIIVNCTGLGAKYLCNDHKLVPMRGQVLKVHAPFVKTFFYGDYDTYVIPGFRTVTLGGCRQYDSYDVTLSRHDAAAIRERCVRLVPALQHARLVREWVGLRPHRDPVRVQLEMLHVPAAPRRMRIVHNYGHGGYGVTTAPGTALYTLQLVKEMLTGNSKL